MKTGKKLWVLAGLSVCFLGVLMTGCSKETKKTEATKEPEEALSGEEIISIDYSDEYQGIVGNGMFFEVDEDAKTASVVSYLEVDQETFVIPDKVRFKKKEYPVTEVGEQAFESNPVLKAVYVGNNVKKLDDEAFYSCPELKEITLPDSLTSIGKYALGACLFESITFPESVTHIGDYAFTASDELKKVEISSDISDWGEETFSECANLKTVTFADGADTVGQGAFTNCTALDSVSLPESMRKIEPEAFWGCSSLKNLSLPDGITSIGDNAFVDTAIEELHMPEGVSDITFEMLDGMTELKKLVVPAEYVSSYEEIFGEDYKIETE